MPELPIQNRDHVELVCDTKLAAVSDRGILHATNEDDVRIRVTTVNGVRASIVVVCDGVSSGCEAAQASAVASTAACDFLFNHLMLGGDPRQAMRDAIHSADASIREITSGGRRWEGKPPGATIVAAVVIRRRLIVGWVGDSRCYAIGPGGTKLVTHDHSWVNEVVASGEMTEEKAVKQREAHQISRCLGPLHSGNTDDVAEPGLSECRLDEGGTVVLCTDGLWNYIATADTIASILKLGQRAPDALTQARKLVQYAVQQGGKDNVTAAVALV